MNNKNVDNKKENNKNNNNNKGNIDDENNIKGEGIRGDDRVIG